MAEIRGRSSLEEAFDALAAAESSNSAMVEEAMAEAIKAVEVAAAKVAKEAKAAAED